VGLVVTAALADVGSHAGLAFYALVLAVPFTAAAALNAYGDLIDADEDGRGRSMERLQALCGGNALVLLVLGAAARAPAVGEGSVPRFATTALVLALAVLLVQAAVASARQIREPSRMPELVDDADSVTPLGPLRTGEPEAARLRVSA
jgi:hypothetical protein